MVQCLVFTLLWVCAVALLSLGSTERVSQTTEPSVSRSTDPTAETVTLGPVETQSPGTHTDQSIEEEQEPLPSDPCQDDELDKRVYQRDSHGVMQLVQGEDYKNTCNLSDTPGEQAHCLIYPTNQLNCSWNFHGLPNDSQSYASVFVCKKTERISSVDCVTEATGGQGAQGGTGKADRVVGNVSAGCQGSVDNSATSVILTFNVSCSDVWGIYTHKYQTKDIDVLRPPPDINLAWVREGVLLVQWGLPSSRSRNKSSCFHYQLQINDQVRNFTGLLTYNETNADPTHSHNVKMRVRKSKTCRGSQHWSSWSNTTKVAPFKFPNQLNSLVVVGIALGIPMILLSLLLLIRLQRERLFPHIPGPPLKIKHLLERDDQFQFVPQALQPKFVEEITVVEEAKETPVNLAS
ncbi:uncharacterized protein LOC112260783 isoform X1 [Oncorhynchus tshawytscha]|uniref:uncharacterized protein LOC112260783 isoform X1 n=1 Tax=Oncorhynchus tshawytscha TaxID=74940 RepID=UPI000D09C109|nr:uncharacterized protein LOC112260783 isoform X1 [Oncorhynchus tshawytscha]XP_042184847.1 uncharacterized protein LOC112260783 isoform X1 [Oncorhynchus tshawytscha]